MLRAIIITVLVLVPISYADAQIPTVERDALIALYTATNGAGWTDNTGWDTATLDTECTWFGVTCDGGNVWFLDLNSNQLSGSIPPELGNLTILRSLSFLTNQLSGRIPPELGNLSNLYSLNLGSNQLSGGIPREIGNLSNLGFLFLHSNQLSGRIPPELGNLSNLFHGFMNIGYNALWTDNPTLQAFLYYEDPDWDQTQTISPADVAAGSETGLSFVVSWTPITYTADDGGYLVSVAPASWIFADSFETGDTSMWGEEDAIPIFVEFMTDSKTDSSILVDGLEPGTEYQFAVRTVTEPHANNQNQVVSEQSSAGLATTLPPLYLFHIDASTLYGMNPNYLVQHDGVDLIVRAYGGDKRITNAPLAIDVTIQSGGWERFEVRPSAPGVFVLDCEGCSPDRDTLTIDIH